MSKLRMSGSFTLLAVASMTIMVGCVIVPGLPSIAKNLDVPNAAGWLVTVPSLGVVVFGPFVGRLIRALGLRRALCWGLFLYGLLGGAGVFLRGTIPVLADRLLLGGATAIVMSAGTGLLSEFFHGKERLAMLARQGMAIEFGGVIFLFIGGVLAAVGWRWPFLLYLVSWLVLAMVLAFVPALTSIHEEAEASTDQEAAGLRRVIDVYFAACVSMVLFFAGVILLPFRLSEFNWSETEVGGFLSFVSMVAVGGAAVMPYVVRLVGDGRTLAVAFGCYALSHLVFLTATSTTGFLLGGILLGCGFGLSIPLVNHMTVERSSSRLRGHFLAYLSVAIFAGQFFASFLEFMPGQAGFAVASMISAPVGVIFAAGFGAKIDAASETH